MPVVTVTIDSKILKGNALGDPSVRSIPVYLPLSYEREPARRYPSLYFLPGFTGDGWTLLNRRPFEPSLIDRYEKLLTSGAASEAILVMPDCFTRFGGSEYMNSSATGRYFDFVTDEIIPAIDAQFRTQPSGEHRGVAGRSSGGIGALRFAMKRPDLFGACASHSGDMLFEVAYFPWFLRFVNTIGRHGGLHEFLRSFPDLDPKSGEAIDLANVVAMCQAYSPSMDAPGFELPFDLETGALRPEVFARWLEHDPVRMVDRYAGALSSLRLLYIDCGSRDEYQLHLGARALSRCLRERKIVHEAQEFDGTHRDASWRVNVSLPKLTRAIGSG